MEKIHDESRYAVKEGGTILVIDDDLMLRSLTGCILRKEGFNVITAENGVEGISKFRMESSAIKGVILDLNMPLKNGYETLPELLYLKPELRILMTSGDTNPQRINELKEAGAYDFIGKPFSVIDLSAKVKEMVNAPLENNCVPLNPRYYTASHESVTSLLQRCYRK